MQETMDTIIQWHTETFPNTTLTAQTAKWDEEMAEFKSATPEEKLSELADLVIVSAGIARFDKNFGSLMRLKAYMLANKHGFDMVDLWDAVDAKMAKNRKRAWAKQKNGSYHHTNKE